MIYGYARISTPKQVLDRQIRNIQERFPGAIIIREIYTGTSLARPEWEKLKACLKSGDTIVFDSVSRMSRNADEGFREYEELFNAGITLIFLKEPHIDTEVYQKAKAQGLTMTGTSVDLILSGINAYLLCVAKEQIQLAFSIAQMEVDTLRVRTKEGIDAARLKEKQIGQQAGAKLHIKKADPIKKIIREKSRWFDGTNNDSEVLSILAGREITIKDERGREKRISAKISRSTYYRYLKEMMEEKNQ